MTSRYCASTTSLLVFHRHKDLGLVDSRRTIAHLDLSKHIDEGRGGRSRLAEMMYITDHRTLLKYLHLLQEAALVTLLRSDAKGNKMLQKPEKIYLNNTNLSKALGLSKSDTGTERETFFLSQVSAAGQVRYPKTGDFLVDNEVVFEIGGKGMSGAKAKSSVKRQFGKMAKSGLQLQGGKYAYIAADDIETGFASKIPLWLFGFLY